jgi:hypothetical protein
MEIKQGERLGKCEYFVFENAHGCVFDVEVCEAVAGNWKHKYRATPSNGKKAYWCLGQSKEEALQKCLDLLSEIRDAAMVFDQS